MRRMMFWQNAGVIDGEVVIPECPAPVVTVTSGNSVTVGWDSYANESSYGVYRSATDNFGAAVLVTTVPGSTHSYSDSPPLSWTTYYYWVERTDSWSQTATNAASSNGRKYANLTTTNTTAPTFSTSGSGTLTCTNPSSGGYNNNGKCMYYQYSGNAGQSKTYATTFDVTWSQLGVPSGVTVSSVSLSAIYSKIVTKGGGAGPCTGIGNRCGINIYGEAQGNWEFVQLSYPRASSAMSAVEANYVTLTGTGSSINTNWNSPSSKIRIKISGSASASGPFGYGYIYWYEDDLTLIITLNTGHTVTCNLNQGS